MGKEKCAGLKTEQRQETIKKKLKTKEERYKR